MTQSNREDVRPGIWESIGMGALALYIVVAVTTVMAAKSAEDRNDHESARAE